MYKQAGCKQIIFHPVPGLWVVMYVLLSTWCLGLFGFLLKDETNKR